MLTLFYASKEVAEHERWRQAADRPVQPHLYLHVCLSNRLSWDCWMTVPSWRWPQSEKLVQSPPPWTQLNHPLTPRRHTPRSLPETPLHVCICCRYKWSHLLVMASVCVFCFLQGVVIRQPFLGVVSGCEFALNNKREIVSTRRCAADHEGVLRGERETHPLGDSSN